MRVLTLAIIATLFAAPALAQPAPAQPSAVTATVTVRLTCDKTTANAEAWKAIARSDYVMEAPAHERGGFCLYVGTPEAGPWRSYAVVQMGDFPYWCGSAGCLVVIFLQDQTGAWRFASDPDMTHNGFAKEEGGLTLDAGKARDGLPAIGIPQYRHDNDLETVVWIFDPATGAYSWEIPPEAE
jgi:hypothetical protein